MALPMASIARSAAKVDFAPTDGSVTGAKMSGNVDLFTDHDSANRCIAAGAILKYVRLPVPGHEKTASGDQIVDPNE